MAAEKSATKMIKAPVTMALALFASYELVLATKKESFFLLFIISCNFELICIRYHFVTRIFHSRYSKTFDETDLSISQC